MNNIHPTSEMINATHDGEIDVDRVSKYRRIHAAEIGGADLVRVSIQVHSDGIGSNDCPQDVAGFDVVGPPGTIESVIADARAYAERKRLSVFGGTPAEFKPITDAGGQAAPIRGFDADFGRINQFRSEHSKRIAGNDLVEIEIAVPCDGLDESNQKVIGFKVIGTRGLIERVISDISRYAQAVQRECSQSPTIAPTPPVASPTKDNSRKPATASPRKVANQQKRRAGRKARTA